MIVFFVSPVHYTHLFIPKRSAPWNEKAERTNRSVDDEFYLNTGKPWRTFLQHTHWYNYERYNLGISKTSDNGPVFFGRKFP